MIQTSLEDNIPTDHVVATVEVARIFQAEIYIS